MILADSIVCDVSRVAEGLSLDSHAAKCAELFGVPAPIVDRAQYVRRGGTYGFAHVVRLTRVYFSKLLSTHQLGRLLDEGMTEAECVELKDAEAICRRFLAWDLEKSEEDICEGEAKKKLGEILGRLGSEGEE